LFIFGHFPRRLSGMDFRSRGSCRQGRRSGRGQRRESRRRAAVPAHGAPGHRQIGDAGPARRTSPSVAFGQGSRTWGVDIPMNCSQFWTRKTAMGRKSPSVRAGRWPCFRAGAENSLRRPRRLGHQPTLITPCRTDEDPSASHDTHRPHNVTGGVTIKSRAGSAARSPASRSPARPGRPGDSKYAGSTPARSTCRDRRRW
jgi:hypothetical protein